MGWLIYDNEQLNKIFNVKKILQIGRKKYFQTLRYKQPQNIFLQPQRGKICFQNALARRQIFKKTFRFL